MTDWKPIKTAPKDATRILVFNAMVGACSSNLEDGEYPLRFWDYEGIWFPKPTHWMPMPDAPEHQRRGAEHE